MKALLATLALFVAISAQARSIQIAVDRTLPNVVINGQKTKLVGVAHVDLLKEEITLSLYQDPCGSLTAAPGTIHCMAMPTLKRTYTAPLQTRKGESCNTAVYAGQRDQRPVDGDMTALKLVDNTFNTCEMVLPFVAQMTVIHQTAGFGAPAQKTIVKATAK